MAYEAPTPASFKARFPEFEPVADNLVDRVLDEAIPQVDETWLERDRANAQMYLTAHLLASEGEPSRSKAIADGEVYDPSQGAIKRDKVGDVETEYFGSAGSSASIAGAGASYSSTSYGRQFERIQRANFGGPQIITA